MKHVLEFYGTFSLAIGTIILSQWWQRSDMCASWIGQLAQVTIYTTYQECGHVQSIMALGLLIVLSGIVAWTIRIVKKWEV